jgi:hypothetical protein
MNKIIRAVNNLEKGSSMSTSKNLKVLLAGSLLLTLVSCGNDHNSKSHAKAPSCGDVDCLSSVNWKIVLQGRSFPDKSRVDINGSTVLNECVSKQKYAIDRTAEPEQLYLENYLVPKRGDLKIDVIDMGHDCASESTFISNDKVDFEVSKTAGQTEILISL